MVSEKWRQLSLGEVATLQRGYDLPHKERKPGTVPIISSSGSIDTHNESRVAGPGVVTGRYGTIGEVFFVSEDFWPLNTTLFVKDFKGNDPLFISFLLRTIDYHSYSGKSGVPGVNRNDLHEIGVSLPTLSEQQAIATALSDVDALITSLNKLIAKKRDIKQATMQQLLIGKTRLPGFSGEWSSRLLSDVCWFQEGPGVRYTQFTRSGIKLLNGTNIYRGEVILESTDRFISEKEAFGPYAHFLVDRGDIIIACSGITIDRFHEKVAFVKEAHLPLCMNTSTMRFKASNNCLLANFW